MQVWIEKANLAGISSLSSMVASSRRSPSMVSVKMACDRELTEFMAVAAVTRCRKIKRSFNDSLFFLP